MGERKVLNFYISPDFDASIIPRVKRDWDKAHEIRMMLPFSMRCNTCGEYMYRGKKFNSKKEMVKGEDYLGIRIFRFIIKCSVCSAEITFKTDPQNSDYTCESGASRNFEVWRDNEAAIDEAKKQREDEDKLDAMKSLENRTIDSKLEMDVLDALDEIKSMNQRHANVDPNDIIATYTSSSSSSINQNNNSNNILTQEDYDKLDDEILKSIKFKNKNGTSRLNQPLSDSDEEQPDTSTHTATSAIQNNNSNSLLVTKKSQPGNSILSQLTTVTKPANSFPAPFPIVIAKKKRKVDEIVKTATTNATTKTTTAIDTIQKQTKSDQIALPVTKKLSQEKTTENTNGIGSSTAAGNTKKFENAMSSLLDYGDDDEEEEDN